MTRYRIEITPTARKTLATTAAPVRGRLDVAIQALAVNPRPSGVKKLKAPDRICIGSALGTIASSTKSAMLC